MENTDKNEVVNRAIQSVKWSGLGSLLPRLITPISTLILAGLLTPNDFGIVAICMSLINFAQIIVEMGIGKAIIQRRTDVNEAASVAFALNMLLAMTMFTGIWLFAPFFARVYDLPELVLPLRVSAFTLVLSGFISIPNALLTREMYFRRLFVVSVLPQFTTAAISVTVAIYRADYWALLIGYLVGNLTQAIIIWFACSWRPKLVVNFDLIKSILRFSIWILVSNLLSWIFLYADNLLGGYFLGSNALGIYALGFNLANLIPGMLVSSMAAIAYPAFSALQNDPKKVGESLYKLQSIIAVFIFPICFGLSAIGAQVVNLLYGEKWQGLSVVLLYLCIMPGLSHLWSLNAEAYRAIGRPDIWTKAAALTLMILIPLLIVIGIRKDLQLFVLARFFGAFLLPIFNILYARRALGLSLSEQWASIKVPLISASIMYMVVHSFSLWLNRNTWMSGWANLLVVILTGATFYLILIRVSNRSKWNDLYSLTIRAIRSN